MAAVTLNSTVWFRFTWPRLLRGEPLIAGALLSVITASVQGVLVPNKLFETENIEPP